MWTAHSGTNWHSLLNIFDRNIHALSAHFFNHFAHTRKTSIPLETSPLVSAVSSM